MVLEQTPLGSISYTYDALGRRTSMTVAGQPTVSYQYDATSRLTGMQTTINGVGQGFSLAYDALGRRTALTLPNGVQTSYSYDASRLQQILHQKVGNPLENIQYQYDASGNRTSYTRNVAHPPLPQEIQATFNAANQMLSLNDKSFQYDLNGNLTQESSPAGVRTYSWDSQNRLTGISGPGLSVSFKYDALGRRIEKTINSASTQYLYDGLDIVAEMQSGAVTSTYLRSLNIDEPFSRTKGGITSYYLQDELGSIIGLADTTGTLTTTYTYDAFGTVSQSGAASDQPFKFAGREDDGTGLFYYRARYYSPEMRRFITEDAIGFLGGNVNFYLYALNSPITYLDLNGYAPKKGKNKSVGIGDLCAGTIINRLKGGGCPSEGNCLVCCGEILQYMPETAVVICIGTCTTALNLYIKQSGKKCPDVWSSLNCAMGV